MNSTYRRRQRQKSMRRKKSLHNKRCEQFIIDKKRELDLIMFENIKEQVDKNIKYDEVMINLRLQKNRCMQDLINQRLLIDQSKIDQTLPFDFVHLTKYDLPIKKLDWYTWVMNCLSK